MSTEQPVLTDAIRMSLQHALKICEADAAMNKEQVAMTVVMGNKPDGDYACMRRAKQLAAEESANTIRALLSAQQAAQVDAKERYFAYEFEVWQGDEKCAGSRGVRENALKEAMHYAQIYSKDGNIRVFEVTKTLVAEVPAMQKKEQS